MFSTTAEQLGGVFGSIVTNPGLNIGVTALVILTCFGVCAMGLEKGVERITKVMMVMLLVLILGLGIYACTLPGAGAGLKFYLVPTVQPLKEHGAGTVISAAMSQAFFTLSLGIGSIAIFGSYIDRERSLLGETFTIVSLDTFVALMSGLVIFPAFFTFNPGATGIGAEQAGAGFLFTTLSSIFNNMAGGRIIGTLFFLFMVFAALSTVIAVFENIMSFWLEWTKLRRWQIAIINVVLLFVLTMPFIFSNVGGFFAEKIFLGRNFGDFEDFLVSNMALPIGSLVYILFCTQRFGWGWKNYDARNARQSEARHVHFHHQQRIPHDQHHQRRDMRRDQRAQFIHENRLPSFACIHCNTKSPIRKALPSQIYIFPSQPSAN